MARFQYPGCVRLGNVLFLQQYDCGGKEQLVVNYLLHRQPVKSTQIGCDVVRHLMVTIDAAVF